LVQCHGVAVGLPTQEGAMPQKKQTDKRSKKAKKVADLPARSVKAKDAAKVKGGAFEFARSDGGGALKLDSTLTDHKTLGILDQSLLNQGKL
jgi:hypothetical protein